MRLLTLLTLLTLAAPAAAAPPAPVGSPPSGSHFWGRFPDGQWGWLLKTPGDARTWQIDGKGSYTTDQIRALGHRLPGDPAADAGVSCPGGRCGTCPGGSCAAPAARDLNCQNPACNCTFAKSPTGPGYYVCPGQLGRPLPGCSCAPAAGYVVPNPPVLPQATGSCPGGVCPAPTTYRRSR